MWRAVLALGCVLCATGCGGGASHPQPAGRFDSARAWSLVRMQLGYGQRPAGSPQLRRLAVRLRALLPHGRFEPLPHEPGLRNVVGTLPGSKPGIVVGAHYDTLASPKGFVGANNGAAGPAIVIEVARALAREKRRPGEREVRFVLFDGEEPARGLPEQSKDFFHAGLRGSRAYVAANPHRSYAMLLLDYVANKGLRLPREANSSPRLWARVRAAAKAVGAARTFPPGTGPALIDDHSPFLAAGVPSVDLIDWTYPGHAVTDRLDKLSPRSIDAVGETVTAAVQGLR
jgi:Zn-dependent M28 family amino/carboxypeptidase